MIIVITGATGLIGKALAHKLIEQGHTIHILTRNIDKKITYPCKVFLWADAYTPPDPKAFPLDSDFAIIHLAGESISSWPWTKNKKKKIYDSRIAGTKTLRKAVLDLKKQAQFFISANAVGIYGEQKEGPIAADKEIKLQDLFLQKVCKDWQNEALKFQEHCPTIILRLGLVLSQHSGFLKQQLLLSRFLVPWVLSKKLVSMSWIHIEDLSSLVAWLVTRESIKLESAEPTSINRGVSLQQEKTKQLRENQASHHSLSHQIQTQSQEQNLNIYNATAPQPTNWAHFFDELALRLNKKYLRVPVFIFVMKLFMGEMGKNLLASCAATPNNLKKAGFKFQYKDIDSALKNLVGKKSTG